MYTVLMPDEISLPTACVVAFLDRASDGAGVVFDVFVRWGWNG